MKYILALDQGTTSSRTVLFDASLRVIAIAQKEFTQYFPHPGRVEHDAEEIWETQLSTVNAVLIKAGITAKDISVIGITNQRETVVAWNKISGKPVCNAIVWQDRRTADFCSGLIESGLEKYIQENTGLVADAYFSGTKIKWILDSVPGARKMAENGELLCGTIDTWLLWKLTGGKTHATDTSNASRTLLFNIKTLQWDTFLLDALTVPENILPEIKNAADNFGNAIINDVAIPVRGVAGDQQAALFGQQCFTPGTAKNTYGTGCFMLMHIGNKPVISSSKLLTTIAWTIDNKTDYALEGSVFIGGAVVQWLRDQLQIISSSEESEAIAAALENNGGVYFVPAFTGLGAPHWDMYARGIITGLTRGTHKSHIVRAALESIAYQTKDIFEAMQKDTGIYVNALKVDGGASKNNWLMQFQSDILQTTVIRPENTESTALGAAMLAGIGAGIFKRSDFTGTTGEKTFLPQMQSATAAQLFQNWQEAVHRSTGNKI